MTKFQKMHLHINKIYLEKFLQSFYTFLRRVIDYDTRDGMK